MPLPLCYQVLQARMKSRSTKWPTIAAIHGKLDAEAYGDWTTTVLLQEIVVNLILKAVQKPMR